jgi:imidazolonepropionase-like amidohydrolase
MVIEAVKGGRYNGPHMTQQSIATATLGLATLLSCLFLPACAESPPATGTAITNVTVIDAASGVRENHTVIFDGDEIVAVGPSDSELPASAVTIDGTGKFLIPGLWDMHVHLTYDDAYSEQMPKLFLSYGITSVRDTGGLIEKLEPVIARMRAPDALAPRVFYSGPLLDGEFVVYDGDGRPEIGIQNSTVEMAEAHVAELKAAGVDFIKTYEMVSPEVFEALVAAGRKEGLPIAAHVPLSMLASVAGPQVDSMEHLRNIELDCAGNAEQLLSERLEILHEHQAGAGAELRTRLHSLQRGPAMDAYDDDRCRETIASLQSTIQVPTLRLNTLGLHPPFARDDWQKLLAQVPDSDQGEWQELFTAWSEGEALRDPKPGQFSLHLVGKMHAAGVPIGAGTDTPIGLSLPGYSLHTELERLVEAGLTPLEALRSATQRPAEFFSLQNEMGSIEVGQKADLVLLEKDPLENITNTRTIVSVVSKGRLLGPHDLD